MKQNNYILYIVLILILFSACEKEVIFKSDMIAPKLVVNSFIYNDSFIDVKVYATHAIPGFESTSPIIKNAVVTLYSDDKELERLEYREVLDNNQYSSNYGKPIIELSGYITKLTRPEIGKKYRLEVSHPNYQTVTCETTIPQPISILKVDTLTGSKTDSYGYTEENFNVSVSFADRANETNYYRFIFEMYTGDLFYSNTDYSTGVPSEQSILIRKQWSRFETEDKLLNPEESANDIFFESSNRNTYLLFNDMMINGKEYRCPFYVNKYNYDQYIFNFKEEDALKGKFIGIKITLQTLSYDAYYYMKSLQEYNQSDGMGLFVEPIPVYSNVNNGTGVFGGISSHSYWVFMRGTYPMEGVKYKNETSYY